METQDGGPKAVTYRRPRVLHVIAGLDPRFGGPSYSAPRLARAQADLGAAVALASVADVDAAACDEMLDGYRDIRTRWDAAQTPVLEKLRLSRGLSRALDQTAKHVDVIHNHGLWLMPNIAAAKAARRWGRPFIISLRGMLAPQALAFSRRRKEVFWRLLQGPALRDLACVHVTSIREHGEARAAGLTAPVAIVPNGVDVPQLPELGPTPPDGRREALYLGRLHPIKSVDMLIEAWARLAPKCRAGWRLRIVGPSEEGYGQSLAALAGERGLSDVTIEPPIYGPAKVVAYTRADLFVLPTRNESFGLTVAEALASGTPAICTRGAPWAGLETERCGWWPSHGAQPLAATLESAMETPAEVLRAMGARGRAWMGRAFSWSAAAERILTVYAWLRDGGEPPEAIVPD